MGQCCARKIDGSAQLTGNVPFKNGLRLRTVLVDHARQARTMQILYESNPSTHTYASCSPVRMERQTSHMTINQGPKAPKKAAVIGRAAGIPQNQSKPTCTHTLGETHGLCVARLRSQKFESWLRDGSGLLLARTVGLREWPDSISTGRLLFAGRGRRCASRAGHRHDRIIHAKQIRSSKRYPVDLSSKTQQRTRAFPGAVCVA